MNKLLNPAFEIPQDFVFNKKQETALLRAGFEGADASLDVSLFEYGLIWRKTGTPGEFFLVWHLLSLESPNLFGWGTAREDEFENDFDWLLEDAEQFDALLRFLGESKGDWRSRSLPQKLADIATFSGQEDAFGAPCLPISVGKLIKLAKRPRWRVQ